MKQIPTVKALVLHAMKRANSPLVYALLLQFLHVYKLTLTEPTHSRHGDTSFYMAQNIHELTHCPMYICAAGEKGVKYKVVLSTYKGRVQTHGVLKYTFNIEVARIDYSSIENHGRIDYVPIQKFLWKCFEKHFYALMEYVPPHPIPQDILSILTDRGYTCDCRICRPFLYGFSDNKYWTPDVYDCPVREYTHPMRITGYKGLLNSSQWRL